MAYSRLSIAAAALLVLAIGATAARESGMEPGSPQTIYEGFPYPSQAHSRHGCLPLVVTSRFGVPTQAPDV